MSIDRHDHADLRSGEIADPRSDADHPAGVVAAAPAAHAAPAPAGAQHVQVMTRRQGLSIAALGGAALLVGSGLRGIPGLGVPLSETLGFGAATANAATAATAAATASCTLMPEKTEGPYFVDEKINRSDIRVDTSDGTTVDGIPVTLTLNVVRSDGSCGPIGGATVDLWHATALGKYSDVAQEGTTGKTYLRGYQVSDANGQVTFKTIFPGWYSGRAIHMHLKVRLFDGSRETFEFTSQLFFDPSVIAAARTQAAYAKNGNAFTSNAADNIYGGDGASLIVPLTGDPSSGYAGTYTLGLSGLPASAGTSTSGSTTAGSNGSTTTTTTSNGTTTTGSTAVGASLLSTSFSRTATNRRRLRVRVKIDQRSTVIAKVTRSGKTLGRTEIGPVAAGSRSIVVPISRDALGGKAKLTIQVAATGSGETKTVTKTITLPKRILS